MHPVFFIWKFLISTFNIEFYFSIIRFDTYEKINILYILITKYNSYFLPHKRIAVS